MEEQCRCTEPRLLQVQCEVHSQRGFGDLCPLLALVPSQCSHLLSGPFEALPARPGQIDLNIHTISVGSITSVMRLRLLFTVFLLYVQQITAIFMLKMLNIKSLHFQFENAN